MLKGKKGSELKKEGTRQYIFLLMAVVVLAAAVLFVFYGGDKEMDKLGKAVCGEYNLTYWYVSGNMIYCYTLDLKTGFKTQYEFWVDAELAKKIYLGNRTD